MLIHFHEVQKNVGGQQILANLTLFLPKASYTLITGEKGSGKTMLMRMIMAYERPDQGTLQVDGIDIGAIPARRIPYLRRQIGLIAESPVLLEDKTVSENVSVPLQLAGFDRDVLIERLDSLLKRTGLDDDKNTKVERLTQSRRQLVSAARATIHKPPMVLADEPLHNTEAEDASAITKLLKDANASGATVLITCENAHVFGQHNNATTLTLTEGSLKQHELKRVNKQGYKPGNTHRQAEHI